MLSVAVTLFPDRLSEGLMLAMNQDSMRLALKGAPDIVELRRVEGRWLAEDGNPVEFEVLLTDTQTEIDRFQTATRVMTAGRG